MKYGLSPKAEARTAADCERLRLELLDARQSGSSDRPTNSAKPTPEESGVSPEAVDVWRGIVAQFTA
jgi:hypothetical protein